jgi:velvet factor protein
VQLRILEGATFEEATDITNAYNASFFVFVDLQHARPMANGRVQTPAATSPPVLTGSPVSGMALLDRPSEAGYFLFPDLSVRHEGRYVLGFTLYEHTKEERDSDAEPLDDTSEPGFLQRMRVVSQPFVVFSAKKFPGLKHSTSLSRTISEQGCRVRIRREVRMRRRESKQDPNAGGNDAPRSRPRAQSPPDARVRELPAQYRGRSDSNSSHHREPYLVPDRRPSEVDAYPPPPPPPAPMASPRLRYGSDSKPSYTSQYSQNAPVPPPISPTSAYPSQSSPYSAAPPPLPPYSNYPTRHVPSYPPTPSDTFDRRSSTATAMPPSPSHSHYAGKEEHRRDSGYKMDYDYTSARSSVPKLEADYPSAREVLAKLDPDHIVKQEALRRDSAPLSAGLEPPVASHQIPSIKPIGSPNMRSSRVSVSLPGVSSFRVSPNEYSPSAPSQSTRPSDIIEAAPPSKPVPEQILHAGSKRGFTDTFVESTKALSNGERQEDSHHKIGGRSFGYDSIQGLMTYPRADGTMAHKLPNEFYS